MDWPKLRAWWAYRQGLLSREHCSNREVFAKFGWSRSVGGVNPYLTLLARNGATPSAANKDLANLEILELPSARGCTYVLPKEHFELGLKACQVVGFGVKLNSAERSVGVTDDEIESLGREVKKALASGPLDPKALKDHVGHLIKNYGDEGKKKGITTNLPTALSRLQVRGEIVRIPSNGRFDTQRYAYRLWNESPIYVGDSADAVMLDLAKLFFKWIGPAKVSEFAAFAGLGVGTSKKVCLEIGLVALEHEMMLLPEDVEAYNTFQIPDEPSIRLVGSLDAIALARREAADLVGEADKGRAVYVDSRTQAAGGLRDFYANVILDRGQIVGVWEFDATDSRIVYQSWAPITSELTNEVTKLEAIIQDELGDARTFSLDTPQSRVQKIEFIKQQPALV